MFARIIYSSHGLPKNIITDRAGLFMDKFWQTFTAKMGTKSKMSSAYHPETDGQVERMNQTLEQYLRCFVNGKQNDWRSEEHTSELQSRPHLVCRLLLEKKKKKK